MNPLASWSGTPDKAPRIPDTEARKALQLAYALAYRQWARDGRRLDFSEYHDTALTALTGCLERYHNAGKSFSSYAYVRMHGACQDAAEAYAAWHYRRGDGRASREEELTETVARQQWLTTWPLAAQPYAAAILAGYTDAEYAQQAGISVVTLWKWRKKWRALLAVPA